MAHTRTSKLGSFKIKPLVVDPQDRFHVGVDVHGATYKVSLWSVAKDQEVASWTQPADPKLLASKLESVRSQIVQIVYEAGPTGFGLARYLLEHGWKVIVTSPGDAPTSRNQAKSDRLDARKLARLSCKALLGAIYIPTVAEEQRRQVQRLRQRVLGNRKRAQQRIKSLLLLHGLAVPKGLKHWSQAGLKALKQLACSPELEFCLKIYIGDLEHAQQQLHECDKQLKHLAECPEVGKRVDNLQGVPGIGQRTSLEYVLEMGCPSRFDDKRKVSKYQGLAPDVSRSGETSRYEDLNCSGNRRLKTLLVEAAWRWVRYDPGARLLYQKMLGNTGCSQKAITAVARKLGIILWRMDQSSSPYRPKALEVPTKEVLAEPKRATRQVAAAGQ